MGIEFLFPPSVGEGKQSARSELVGDALSRRLGVHVRVRSAESYEDLEHRIVNSTVDFAWTPPVICARVESQVRAILKVVRANGTRYGAALVSRRDDPLTLESLAGRRVAWVDPRSTSGFVLPRTFLLEEGIDLGQLAEEKCVGSYYAAVEAVLHGHADFCSVFCEEPTPEAANRSLMDLLGALRHRLQPFAFTGQAPSDGIVVTFRSTRVESNRLTDLLRFDRPGRVPSVLLDVLRAHRFELAPAGEYERFAEVAGTEHQLGIR